MDWDKLGGFILETSKHSLEAMDISKPLNVKLQVGSLGRGGGRTFTCILGHGVCLWHCLSDGSKKIR